MKLPGFASGFYGGQSLTAAGLRCVNLIPEPVPMGGKTQYALYPSPGLPTFAEMPKAPGRGIYSDRGRVFTVFSDGAYEIGANGLPTPIGSVLVDANPAAFATNGDLANQLVIASGGRTDVVNLTTMAVTTNVVTPLAFLGDLDGFIVGLDTTSSTLRISEFGDALTWDPTQIANRTAASDPWLAMIIVSREIFLLGERTGEVWFNAGRSPFPFAQRPGAFFETGIIAPATISRFAGSFAWLGRTPTGSGGVYRMNGYTPEEFSTPAIRWAIQQHEDAGDISQAIGWGYSREGHDFYVLEFPLQNRTYVFDGMTGRWHERGIWDPLANDFQAYRARFHALCFGRNLVCDGSGASVFSLSSTVYTDAGGAELRRLVRSPHISQENRRLFFPYFELECDRGEGLNVDPSAPGYNPQVALRYSNTGGRTWSDNRQRSTGLRGDYRKRVRWDGCGSGRDRMWELWSSDPVPTRWLDAYVGVT